MRNKIIVKIGNIKIGGREPIRVQSMTKSKTEDLPTLLSEIKRLKKAGCELVRLAVKTETAVNNIKAIKKSFDLPFVADVHFDYRLAIKSIKAGFDKIRINPFNITKSLELKEIALCAKEYGIPVRIGLNAGGLRNSSKKQQSDILLKRLKETVALFEKASFSNIVISAKTTDPLGMIDIYHKIDEEYPYPLHLGLTEAGLPFEGGIRSATVIGILLSEEIGDTIRISLTGDSTLEVIAGYEILQTLGLRNEFPRVLSCPTCGRCEVDLIKLTQKVKKEIAKLNLKKPITIAVMGCEVNGPGEASHADFGIACGKNSGVIFAKGGIIKKYSLNQIVPSLIEVIKENKNE